MSAKIVITGLDTFPDGHIVFAIAKGGPMYPFGYLLQVSSFISVATNPPLYRDFLRRCRISATGVIISEVSRMDDETVVFELETLTRLVDSTWCWTLM